MNGVFLPKLGDCELLTVCFLKILQKKNTCCVGQRVDLVVWE